MELMLTDAEKKAATWLELDDESVGKVVKASGLEILKANDEKDKTLFYSAALILINLAANSNADILKETISGLTISGKPYGNWQLIIKKVG
jgi:hypothetical protein